MIDVALRFVLVILVIYEKKINVFFFLIIKKN